MAIDRDEEVRWFFDERDDEIDCSKYKRVSALKRERRSSHRRKTWQQRLGEREQQRVDEVRYKGNGIK